MNLPLQTLFAALVFCSLCRPLLARPEPPSPLSGGYLEHHGDDLQGGLQDYDDRGNTPSDTYGAPFTGMTTFRARPIGSQPYPRYDKKTQPEKERFVDR